MRTLLIALCLALPPTALAQTTSSTTAPTTRPAPRDLLDAIDLAVDMLEKQQYEAMLERFIEPSEKREILKKQTLAKLVEGFKGDKAAKALDILKQARQAGLSLAEDGTRATHRPAKGRGITLVKTDGQWYIAN